MGISYSKEYEINYYDVDNKLDCTVTKLLSILSDIGNKHMEALGCGINELIEEGITWVFYNYKIDIKRYPKYGEKIIVNTIAEGFKKFYATRNYEIKDKDGNTIATGNAVFLMIDLEKRKAIRIPKKQYELFKVEESLKSDFKLPRIKDIDEVSCSEEFKVRYSDIDSNNHVNNTNYVQWAIETLPEEIIFNYKLDSVNVIFERECKYGQRINVYTKISEQEDGTIQTEHKIENENKEVLTRLEGKWSKL